MHYAAMMLITAVLSIVIGPNADAFDRSYKAAAAGEYRAAVGEFGVAMKQVIRDADVHNQDRRP